MPALNLPLSMTDQYRLIYRFKLFFITILLAIALAGRATAAGVEDGAAAFVVEDYSRALEILMPLAEQGQPRAQVLIGYLHYQGKGVPQSFPEAMKWYHLAAKQADLEAQYFLGKMYAAGNGVPANHEIAAAWYRSAATGGHALSQYNLGISYKRGEGLPQDFAQAVAWFRKAAYQGLAEAQGMIGAMYYLGEGVPQDDVLSYMWANLSVAQGDKSSVKLRDALNASLTREQIAEAQLLARTCHGSGFKNCP